jgi:hypothetical protein
MAKMNGKKGNVGRELLFVQVEENEGPELLNPSMRSSNNTPLNTDNTNSGSSLVDKDSNSHSKELAQSIVSDKQERLLGKG